MTNTEYGMRNQALLAELRRAAETRLRCGPARDDAPAHSEDLQRLVHELQVHQIELEMQNAELRQTRGELEQALTCYTELYEFAPVGYFTFDQRGTVRQANLAGTRLLGAQGKSLLGRRFADFVAPESAAHFAGLLERIHRTHEREPCEITLTTALTCETQPPKYLSVRIDIAPGGDGESILAAITDLTATKAANDRLRMLSRVVEQSPNSIVITDTNGNVQYVNATYTVTSGYTFDEVKGKNLRLHQSGQTPREVFEALWATLARGEIWRGEFINRHKNGEIYPESEIIAPVFQEDGQISHYIGIKQDIRDQKRASAELDRYRNHLEDLVVERSGEIELLNRKLEKRVHEAEAANRAKSTFLANMSHEIRTPMNAILGLTNILLRRGGLSSDQQDKLGKVGMAGKHLLTLINDILDLSKIEAGKLDLEQADFSLEEMIHSLRAIIDEPLRAKGLAFRVDTDHLPYVLCGDLTRLRQALLNYLGNAVKFTEHGGIALRATVLEETDRDLLIRFAVEDTGIGVSQDQRARLFAAFEQADGSTTRKFGGTGLGLAINRHLAGLMGGEVGLADRPGGGSIFWLTARLAKASAPDSVEHAAPCAVVEETAEQTLLRDFSGYRLLVAEDDEVNRLVALELLGESGLHADFAVNGRQAALMALANQYDLILMDVQMPEMDGIAATRAIRRMPHHAATPILAMTANAFDEDRQACLQAGMNDHLAKPVEPEELYKSLVTWLRRNRLDKPNQAAAPHAT